SPSDWHYCQVHRRPLSQETYDQSLTGCGEGGTRSPSQGINDGMTLQVFHPLKQPCLVPFGFREKSCEPRRRETSALFVALSCLAQFCRHDGQFPLGTPRKLGIELRFTGNPLVLHKGIEDPDIE